MKMNSNKKKIVLAALSLGMVLSVSVGSAFAYFIDSKSAAGGYEVELGSNTELNEDAEGMQKAISVTNTGDSDAYIRVMVSAGGQQDLSISGDNWSEGTDGYWYYSEVVKPGETTSTLTADIEAYATYKDNGTGNQTKENADFDVLVSSESCPAIFADASTNELAANTASYKGWSLKAVIMNSSSASGSEEVDK